MLTDLAGWAPQTGAVGLLLAAVWAVLTGRIVPRSTHDEVRRDRDVYRAAAETALKANVEQAASVAKLTSTVETLTASQRETTDLVRRLLPGDRSAA
jgi:hypothetical protein